jgi:hypothetical protein
MAAGLAVPVALECRESFLEVPDPVVQVHQCRAVGDHARSVAVPTDEVLAGLADRLGESATGAPAW